MDARRTPGGIFNDHLKDQVTDFFGNSLPAAHWVSGLAQLGPVPSESLAVPADHGLGHDEEERLFPLRPELESGDPKELVEHTEFWFGMSALQHDKLLSKNQVLQKQILSVANTAKGCSEPQAKQVEHGGRVIADEILACTPMVLISKPDRIVARDTDVDWKLVPKSLLPCVSTGTENMQLTPRKTIQLSCHDRCAHRRIPHRPGIAGLGESHRRSGSCRFG